jgi:hypothetical protein
MLGDAVHATLPYLASGYVTLSAHKGYLTVIELEWLSKMALFLENVSPGFPTVPI